MTDQTPASKPTLMTGVQVGQLATMIAGFAGMVFALGIKSADINAQGRDIEKLAAVVSDLAKAQASAAVTDAVHARTLEDIQRRLEAIERTIHREQR